MSAKKKLIILLSTLCIAFVIAISAVVIVLVAGNQTATSTINMEFVATDVAVDINASLYHSSNTSSTPFKTADNSTTLSITPKNKTGELSQTESVINFSASHPRAVLAYTFTNKSYSVDALIKLTDTPDNVQNVKVSYIVTESYVGNMANLDYTTATDTLDDQLLASSPSTYAKKYIYVIIELKNELLSASFEGSFAWKLERTEAVSVTINNTTAGTTRTISVLSGAKLYEPDFESLDNKRFNGYTLNANLVSFPIVVTEDITLIPQYQMSTLPITNYIFDNEKNGYEVYGYIESSFSYSDLIIPDQYEGYPVVSINADRYDSGILDTNNSSYGNIAYGLLSETNVSNLYLGNNITEITNYYLLKGTWSGPDYTRNVSDVSYVEFGRKLESVDVGIFSGTGVTDVRFNSKIKTIANGESGGLQNYGNPFMGTTALDMVFKDVVLSCYDNNDVGVLINAQGTTNTANITNWDSFEKIIVPNKYFVWVSDDATSSQLTTATIPAGLTEIPDGLFYDCENLTSTLTIPDGITKIGDYAFYNCYNANLSTIPNSVRYIGDGAFEVYTIGASKLTLTELPSKIEYIGATAFFNCGFNIQNLFLPDSLKYIGYDAFNGCSITSVSGGLGLERFAGFGGVVGLTSVNIDPLSTITTIDAYAFEGCTSLTSITLPDTITEIGDKAFYGCSHLTNMVWPASLTTIGYYAFYNCSGLKEINLPASVTSIGSYSFQNCTGATKITIPQNVTSIGDSAFRDCTYVTEINYNAKSCGNKTTNNNYVFAKVGTSGTGVVVNIGQEVTLIPDYMFSPYGSGTTYTPKMIEVNFLGNKCTTIGQYAFYRNNTLTNIYLPSSLTNIGAYAFGYCTKLLSANIPAKVNTFGDYIFTNCTSLTDVLIEKGVTKVSPRAFYNCTKLVNVQIPDTVTIINQRAFYGCSGLQNIILPDTITTIESYSFYNCSKLQSITIPENVTTIGTYAFQNCKALTEINYNVTNYTKSISSSNYIFAYAGTTGTGITVNIGPNVTKIPNYLFSPYANSSYSMNLKQVRFLGDTCTQIGAYVFRYNNTLKSIVIPASVTKIMQYAFQNSVIESIEFEDSSIWYRVGTDTTSGGTLTDVTNPTQNATWFTATSGYYNYYWYKTAGNTVTYNANGGTFENVSSVSGANFQQTRVEISTDDIINLVDSGGLGNYGFALNADGYYESQNKGNDDTGEGHNSYALVHVSISSPQVGWVIVVTLINQGESTYDYGVFGQLGGSLSYDNVAGGDVYKSYSGLQSPNEQTLEYYITEEYASYSIIGFDVKYLKDGSVNGEVDSLQFKVSIYETRYDYSSYSTNLVSGSAIGTMPTPVRDGYTFLGWSTYPDVTYYVSSSTILTKDTVLYAMWQKN